MARKLVTIQRVLEVAPIPEADAIEKIRVLGWQLVAKKGEFRPGDLCVYFEIDSFLPIQPAFEFLRKSSYRKLDDGQEGFRLRTVKLRGVVSQGLALPVGALAQLGVSAPPAEGAEVTALLGVTKYEPPVPAHLAGTAIGETPSWLVTDETRVQVLQGLLDAYAGTTCYVTEKLDGSSFTAFLDDERALHVCSRKLDLAKDGGNTLWRWAEERQLEDKLRALPFRACIQGELIGEGVQGNPYKLRGQDVRLFNAIDMDRRAALGYDDLARTIATLGFEAVPLVDAGRRLERDIDALVEYARGPSRLNAKQPREGVVIRPLETIVDPRFDVPHARVSFKVINPDFLLGGRD